MQVVGSLFVGARSGCRRGGFIERERLTSRGRNRVVGAVGGMAESGLRVEKVDSRGERWEFLVDEVKALQRRQIWMLGTPRW